MVHARGGLFQPVTEAGEVIANAANAVGVLIAFRVADKNYIVMMWIELEEKTEDWHHWSLGISGEADDQLFICLVVFGVGI